MSVLLFSFCTHGSLRVSSTSFPFICMGLVCLSAEKTQWSAAEKLSPIQRAAAGNQTVGQVKPPTTAWNVTETEAIQVDSWTKLWYSTCCVLVFVYFTFPASKSVSGSQLMLKNSDTEKFSFGLRSVPESVWMHSNTRTYVRSHPFPFSFLMSWWQTQRRHWKPPWFKSLFVNFLGHLFQALFALASMCFQRCRTWPVRTYHLHIKMHWGNLSSYTLLTNQKRVSPHSRRHPAALWPGWPVLAAWTDPPPEGPIAEWNPHTALPA